MAAKSNGYLILKIGALGDIAFTFPLVKAIKEYNPNADICWVVGSPLNTLLEGNPLLSSIRTVNSAKLYSPSRKTQALETLHLAKLCAGSYRAILVCHRDLRYALAIRPFVHGSIYILVRKYPNNWLAALLTRLGIKLVTVKSREIHESYAFRRMVAVMLGEEAEKEILWTWDLSYITSRSFSSFPRPYWVFHVGGGLNAKTEFQVKAWPHWNELCLQFLEKNNLDIVLVGSGEEAANVPSIFEYLKPKSGMDMTRLHNLVGKTSLRELVNILRNALGFVGPDSGPLHFADAMGIPLVALFGATSVEAYGPVNTSESYVLRCNLPCSPCYKDDGFYPDCPYQTLCMHEIEAVDVLAKIELLQSRI
jgi:ADP-heptose:LPS heptosyltransferase